MKVKVSTVPLFSKPISIFSLDEIDNNFILKTLEKEKFYPTHPTKKGICNTFVTEDMNFLEKIPNLKNKILDCTSYYLKEIFKYNIKKHFISISWATKVAPNGFSQEHTHPHSLISGVYYPDGEEEFSISFSSETNCSFWNLPIRENNLYNSLVWRVPVKKNNLILFHSYLKHKIDVNSSKKNRYSIAFTVNPSGTIGCVGNKKKQGELFINENKI